MTMYLRREFPRIEPSGPEIVLRYVVEESRDGTFTYTRVVDETVPDYLMSIKNMLNMEWHGYV